MTIGQLQIDLFAAAFHSLKDKRRLLSSLKQRLRRRLNVAVAESDHQELWQKAQLTVVTVASDRAATEVVFQQVEQLIESQYDVEITRVAVVFH